MNEGAGREAPRSLFRELGRRNVIRVAGLYLIAAWLLLQVADVLIPLFELPVWSGRLLFLALAFGFLFTVIFSWVYELTPEGLKREHEVAAQESITHETGRRLDLLIGAMAALAVVFVIVDRLLPETPRAESSDMAAEDPSIAVLPEGQRKAAASLPAADASIAVLPFVDMSPEGDQEYFAEGIAEELLDLLSKIPALKVISRTSSFQFKDQSEDVRDIAAKLGVAHILEGSVRKAGDRVRITAQLIQASDGSHLWSESYDRTLEDIFAVQDDIAGAVVEELRVQLLGEELPEPATRTANTEAHNLYLRGRYFSGTVSTERNEQALMYFQQAIELAPDYAPAWAGLAGALVDLGNFASRAERDTMTSRARAAAERALELDPKLAEAHAALGFIHQVYDWDWAAAEAAYRRALELDPGNADVLRGLGNVVATLGRLDEAIELTVRSLELDPVRAATYSTLGLLLYYAGRLAEAEAAIREGLALNPDYPGGPAFLGGVLLAQGRVGEAIAAIEAENDEFWKLYGQALAYHAAGRTKDADAALKEMIDEYPEGAAYQIAETHAFRGEVDAAFKWLERAYAARDGGLPDIKIDPLLEPLRGDPRYTALLEKLELAD